MQNQEPDLGTNDDLPQVDELTALKARADLMGLSYHPSIGVEKLRAKVSAAIAGDVPTEDEPASEQDETGSIPPVEVKPAMIQAPPPVYVEEPRSTIPSPTAINAKQAKIEPSLRDSLTPRQYADYVSPDVPGESPAQRRLRKKREAMELIRIRLTCMNPAKKEWEGEIFTSGNNTVGSVTKFVPFAAEEGWHVPRIIYNVIRDREAQIFVSVTDKNKNVGRKGKMIREFAIEVLEPLTLGELDELAQRQAATRAID